MQLTKLQIIEETVNFYSEDPSRRSKYGSSNTCAYNGPGNTHCAVGKCLMSKYKKQGQKLLGNNDGVNSLYEYHNFNSLDKMLSPKYRGHAGTFWASLQNLHDGDQYWTETGLSSQGKEYVDRLRRNNK